MMCKYEPKTPENEFKEILNKRKLETNLNFNLYT